MGVTTTTEPITIDELSHDERPELGWSVRGRQVYMGVRDLLERAGDPKTVVRRHRRALVAAQVDFLLLASRFTAEQTRIADTLAVSLSVVERAVRDLRALHEHGFDPPARPARIPAEGQLR